MSTPDELAEQLSTPHGQETTDDPLHNVGETVYPSNEGDTAGAPYGSTGSVEEAVKQSEESGEESDAESDSELEEDSAADSEADDADDSDEDDTNVQGNTPAPTLGTAQNESQGTAGPVS